MTLRDTEGWAWVDVALLYDLSVPQAYREAPTLPEVLSDDMVETLEVLREQHERQTRRLAQAYRLAQRGRTPPLRAAQRARIAPLELLCQRYAGLIQDLRARYKVCPPELAGWVGALLAFDRGGHLVVKRHLLRRGKGPGGPETPDT